MRLTDDHGNSTFKPEGARPITEDGRLLYLGPILPHERHCFILDGENIGEITLIEAMGSYSKAAPMHGQSKTALIMSHMSAPPTYERG